MRKHEAIGPRSASIIVVMLATLAIAFGMAGCQSQAPAGKDEAEAVTDDQKAVIAEDTSEPMGVTLPSGSTYGNVPGNMSSGGRVNAYDGWVYRDSATSASGIHRVKSDGSSDEILDESGTDSLSMYDGWVYYIDLSDRIYRMRPNGEEKEQLSTFGAHNLNIVDGWMYFEKAGDEDDVLYGEIWKMRVDGSEATLLKEGLWEHLVAYEGWLYFSYPRDKEDPKQRMLCRMSFDGGSFQELEARGYPFVPTDEWVFYRDLDDTALCKMRLDGSDAQKVIDANPIAMSASEDWLYFVDMVDKSTRPLYRLDIGGSAPLLVSDRNCVGVGIAGDRLYFVEQPGEFGFFASTSGNKAYLADLDGSNTQVVNEAQ